MATISSLAVMLSANAEGLITGLERASRSISGFARGIGIAMSALNARNTGLGILDTMLSSREKLRRTNIAAAGGCCGWFGLTMGALCFFLASQSLIPDR